jgi:hypothetical protein
MVTVDAKFEHFPRASDGSTPIDWGSIYAEDLEIEELLKNGSTEWNRLRKAGTLSTDHTGATFENLFSANTDLSGLVLVGTEWDRCDLSKVSFRDTDLSNAYFHGGRLQDCDFRGANLDGATFERLKLLRCDFSGASGLDSLELDDVDMDRVHGLDGEEAPPPPPPPVHGTTSFTREQRQATVAALAGSSGDEPPPFQPQDPPGTLLYRALRRLGSTPPWVLDAPGLRPPLPTRLPPGAGLESLLREAVKQRLEGSRPVTDPDAVKRAQTALRLGSKEAPFAVMYLREVGVEPAFRFSAANALRELLRAELEVDDHTGAVDPRVAGAMWELRLAHDAEEALGRCAGGSRRRSSSSRSSRRGSPRRTTGTRPWSRTSRRWIWCRWRSETIDRRSARPSPPMPGCRRRRDCAGWRTWRRRRRTWSSCRDCRRGRSRPGCQGRSSASVTTRRC